MSECDACGKQENMPYQCGHCGGTYCAEHRLPEAHDCPGLDNWSDPGGVFDSGFDESVNTGQTSGSGGVADRFGIDTGPGGPLAYFRGNVTYLFLAIMGIVFILEHIVILSLGREAFQTLFVLHPNNPEYVWTWVTSVFSHAPFGFYHIFGNGIIVYFFGRLVGRRRVEEDRRASSSCPARWQASDRSPSRRCRERRLVSSEPVARRWRSWRS